MGKMIADALCMNTKNVFFTCNGINMVGIIDRGTHDINYIMGPTDEPFCLNHLYDGIQVNDDKLVIFPYNAKNGYEYSLKEKTWKPIEGLFDGQTNGKEQVCGSILYEDRIYIVSDYYGDVICYEPQKNKYSFPFKLSQRIGKAAFGGQTIGKNGNCIYIARQYTNTIIKCNMDTCEVMVKDIDGGGAFIGTCYDGEYIWIVPKSSSNKLIKWRERDGVSETYDIPSKDYIWGILPLGNNYLIYGYDEAAYIFNAVNVEFSKFDEQVYRASWFEKDEVLMSTNNGKILYYHNGSNKDVYKLDDRKLDEYYRHNAKEISKSLGGTIIQEGNGIQLSDYIAFITT